VSSFYVENFGCRAAQADGATIERDLLQRGLTPAGGPQHAAVVVLNTCTVTASADQDVRAAIRRIHRQNPACRILVTGCYAQRAPHEIAAIPGVSAVIGNSHKSQVAQVACEQGAEILEQHASPVPGANSSPQFIPAAGLFSPGNLAQPVPPEILVGDIFAHTELIGAPVFEAGTRTRPNLKVQDGCNNRCSFCVIPAVRGRSRSLPLAEALREVALLVEAGYREVVISGINLGRWGRDLPGRWRFEDLVRGILEHTRLERLRISSVEPMDWSDELIALVANSSRVARHAHVPLQSGSDRILRQMHRKYRPWHYAERVCKIHAAMPEAAIGADVMVGFPGETDLDFEETRMMVEQLPFTYLHVFTYSARPGTPAASMGEQVPPPVMKQRNRILREIAAHKKLEFMRSFTGRTVSAITLNICENGCTEALTDNYLKLRLPGRHTANQWVTARVEHITADEMAGVIV
jgi:threonylcarbamoyladenosine tRNA methylthiotransferase MtaB